MAQESAAISITIGSKNDTSSEEYIDAHTTSERKDNAILKKPSSLLPLLLRLLLTQAAPRAFGFLDKGTGFPHNRRRLGVPKTYEALWLGGYPPVNLGTSCIRKNKARRAWPEADSCRNIPITH